MKTKIKEVYYCEYCKKYGLSKYGMKKHELICTENTENKRPCFECTNLCKKQVSNYVCNWDGSDSEKNFTLFYCATKEQFMYTPQNEIKNNFKALDNYSNEPMPKECNLFETVLIYKENLDKFFELE